MWRYVIDEYEDAECGYTGPEEEFDEDTAYDESRFDRMFDEAVEALEEDNTEDD